LIHPELTISNYPLCCSQVDGKSGELKKLRTFMPIMEYYCSVGDTSSIIRLFRQMRDASSVFFDAESFGLIIAGLAKHGSFRLDASPIQGAVAAGFSVDHGPKLFDEIAAEMAEDLMELTEAAALTIAQSFEVAFSKSKSGEQMESIIPILHDDNFSPLSAMVGRVTINGTTAICPASGARLRLFALDEKQRKHVHDTLLEMAGIQHQKFAQFRLENPKYKKKPTQESIDSNGDNVGHQELARFSDWLE
jgi:pentatricopeptide repeat protein